MDAAYAAGILDGEGCLTVGTTARVRTYSARVYVGMAVKAKHVLEAMRKKYGGGLKKSRDATDKWDEAWMWSVAGHKVTPLLEDTLPHLMLKGRQAKLLLQLEGMRAEGEWTEQMRATAACLKQSVQDLNRRGPKLDHTSPLPGGSYVLHVAGEWMQARSPDLFDEATWEPSSGAWPTSGISEPGGCWTRGSSECPSGEDGYSACSLADVMESDVPPKYWLSQRACVGILRRADKRGKTLPSPLRAALEEVATATASGTPGTPTTSPAP